MKVQTSKAKEAPPKDTESTKHKQTEIPFKACTKKNFTGDNGYAHTSITIPFGTKDSPSMHLEVATNVDIVTSRSTSWTSLDYLLPRINVCTLVALLVSSLLVASSLQTQVTRLYQEIHLVTKNYHMLQVSFVELSRRFDDSNRKHYSSNGRYLVERDVYSTVSYDYTTEQLLDSNQSVVTEFGITAKEDSGFVTDSFEKSDETRIEVNHFEPSITNATDNFPENLELSEEVFSTDDDDGTSGRSKRSNGRGNKQLKLGQRAQSNNHRNKKQKAIRGGKGKERKPASSPCINNKSRSFRKVFAPLSHRDVDTPDSSDFFCCLRDIKSRLLLARILAVHFTGAFPETVIRDGGSLVAPWFLDEGAAGSFGLSRFHLREGKGAVQVTEAGLYYIYAQVYYLTHEPLNSFTIKLRLQDKTVIPLALCSANASVGPSSESTEVSCFTSVVRYLLPDQQIFVQQRERNRHIIMSDGHTFLGLVRLHNHLRTV